LPKDIKKGHVYVCSVRKKQGANVYVSINDIFNGILAEFDFQNALGSG
jgi:hypothetical protein